MRLRKVRLLRLYGEKSEDMCFVEKGEATLTRNAPTCQINYSYNKIRLIRAISPIRQIPLINAPQIPHLRRVFKKSACISYVSVPSHLLTRP